MDNGDQKKQKSVLGGLSRKGSTFLRRARGGLEKENGISQNVALPSPKMPALTPGSPLTLSTLSPSSPIARVAGGSVASSPMVLPGSASPGSFSMLPDGSGAPMSPKIAGKTPGGLLGSPKKKKLDDLMAAYVVLEKDHERFHSRKVVLKANIVRDNVTPFLRTWHSHPLNTAVSQEDLEYRAMVLSKWWTTLLGMLRELQHDRMSSHERPIVLEAITGIMERAEWRLAMRDGEQRRRGSADEQRRRALGMSGTNGSTTSLTSSMTSGPVMENVSVLFVHHLYEQMAVVVDKMGQRTAPASLVSFCGQACAYAYFFCPGMADILVRLWGVHPTRLKRVLKAFGHNSPFRFPSEAEAMIESLPATLHSLSFKSLKEAVAKLRQACPMPDIVSQIGWHGYWLKRWSGKDSDLFYAFVKRFHRLLGEFVPKKAAKNKWLCAPGVLPVYAQMLANLDMTIHRQASGRSESPNKTEDGQREPPPTTFDDVLGANASADVFGAASINATRIMADQRLVTLLSDVLPIRPPPFPHSAYMFAEGFCELLKATASQTSAHDQAACYTLCDFLQEALVILGKFEAHAFTTPLVDWDFWMECFTRMARSDTTLTQIRLFALLYTIWPMIAAHSRWKEHLCMNVLLDPAYFESHFGHYCALVRTYYQRLLCWRIARCDDGRDVNIRMMRIVYDRLQHIDKNFRLLQQHTIAQGKVALGTEPGTPAPFRRLLIIRTDVAPSPTALALEGMVPHAPDDGLLDLPPPALDDDGGVDPVKLIEKLNLSDGDSEKSKKKGSLFRSMIGSRSPKVGNSPIITARGASPSRSPSIRSREASPSASPAMTPRTSLYQQRPAVPSRQSSTSNLRADNSKSAPTHKEAYFKFSMEPITQNTSRMPEYHKHPPSLPRQYQALLDQQKNQIRPSEDSGVDSGSAPITAPKDSSRYAGVALAEWLLVVNECQNFFERRRREGVPSDRQVETPSLGVESLKRPA